MNNRLYGNLIFELSKPGRKGYSLPKNRYGNYDIPAAMQRQEAAQLPECDEPTVVRHYTNLSTNNFGVDNGFYPLGSQPCLSLPIYTPCSLPTPHGAPRLSARCSRNRSAN